MLSFPEIGPNAFSFELFGFTLALRWYALSYILGILIGWRLMLAVVRRPRLWPSGVAPMTDRHVEDFLISALLGVVLGGRLGYVLFYKPLYFLNNPLEIFMVWTGGMSFHGGLIGVILASLLFARRHSIPLREMADAVALSAPPGLFLGRLANFANAELWGRPTDLPWGVIFPGQAAQACGQAVGELCARHPSQLYEAALEGLLLGLVILVLVQAGALKKPGFVAGTFFAGYGAARFTVEFFRQPDAQFVSQDNPLGLALHVDGYGLTMGQILTIPMVAIGLYLILSARQNAHYRQREGAA